MTIYLKSAIVRIHTAHGAAASTVVGTGFLVTGCHVLTCAHVVTGALGLPGDAQVEKPGFPEKTRFRVHLDFPLLAPESTLIASVSHWRPAIDVAVLELAGGPPAGSKPVRLVTADDLWGHSFRALGFPAGYEQGVWASGVLRGRQADGWLQIEDTKETGYLIAPGFSGAPVWDDALDGVVGVIVAADTDERVKAAFLIPADVLADALPDLVHAYAEWAQVQLDADVDRLRTRRDRADEARREVRARQRVVNLRPLDVTHTFKDRVREVQALCEHLADSSVRLVSVVGRGGMGKTALVSRVLGELESAPETFEVSETSKVLQVDGILYLSARSTGLGMERIYADAGRMLGEPVAGRLEARWADGDIPLSVKVEYLLEAMQDGLYLILLDNLESVMAGDGTITKDGLRLFVERCLIQPGGVRLIATSREQVKTSAAALHSTRSIPLRKGLPEEEAVALLRDLDPQGTLGLRDTPEEDLRRAARLTRGIPRALEILAGILHEDPTASLPRLLADEGLFGEQVVEQLVAAGYSRLGEAERRVMEALAVFDRPVEETAVAYLLHPWWPGLDAHASLRRLVRGYFVSVSRVTSRYSLHPLDREYAYRRIPDTADEEPGAYNRRNLELRAADFYASIRKPEGEWKTIDDLEPQLAEFEHRVRAGDYDDAGRVLSQIDYDYLFLWGRYARLIEMRKKLLDHLEDPGLQAENLGRLGNICSSGRTDSVIWAIEQYEQALGITREIGDRKNASIWLMHLGSAYSNLGQFRQAIRCYNEALAIARDRDIGDRRNEGICLNRLGRAYSSLGRFESAIKLYREGLTIAREISDRRREGLQMGYLSLAHRNLGQTKRFIVLCEEALKIAREIGYRRNEVIWLSRLGSVYRDLGEFERAIEFYEEALGIAHELNYHRGKSHQYLGLGKTFLIIGEYAQAHRNCQESLALRTLDTTYQTLLVLGIVLLHQRNEEAISAFLDAAEQCRKRLDETSDLYQPSFSLATALIGQAICDTRWADESQRPELLASALAEYRRALGITAAPGVVQDAIRDLELIRAAGIEGLEPAFDLLENAEYKPDLPGDTDEILKSLT